MSDAGGADDAVTPEPASAKLAPFPSSLGLSLLASGETQRLQAIVRWGDYRREEIKPDDGEGEAQIVWRRTPRKAEVWLDLPGEMSQPREVDVPDSGGLKLVLSARPVQGLSLSGGAAPPGVRSVSVFLVNRRRPTTFATRGSSFRPRSR